MVERLLADIVTLLEGYCSAVHHLHHGLHMVTHAFSGSPQILRGVRSSEFIGFFL
jgi:hypothetical protein